MTSDRLRRRAFIYAARRITQDEYDKKARELKERQAEFATRIEQHQQGDGEYRTTLEKPLRRDPLNVRKATLASVLARAAPGLRLK
jgi:hypothetical protein